MTRAKPKRHGGPILLVVVIAIAAVASNHDHPGATSDAGASLLTTGAMPANERLADQMATQAGLGRHQIGCLNTLWTAEDGTWSATQWNLLGSGAYGIPQALPADKMAAAGADWQTNARTQIKWGLSYIAGTYRTPCAAWAFHKRHGWY